VDQLGFRPLAVRDDLFGEHPARDPFQQVAGAATGSASVRCIGSSHRQRRECRDNRRQGQCADA
jgi:hypothetical protein